MITCKEHNWELPPVSMDDYSKYHMDNWVDCMRDRNPNTNGNIHTGFLAFCWTNNGHTSIPGREKTVLGSKQRTCVRPSCLSLIAFERL